jgi:hypothetical protein
MSKINDLQYWRRRAEEAGTLAEELTDPDAKRKMLKIAKDYETLARRPEQRLRHHSSATIKIAGAILRSVAMSLLCPRTST